MAGKQLQVRMAKAGIAAIISIISLSLTAAAATYYVDANSGSDSNTGSISQPFRTIQKAANVMTAGDMCLVRKGTYRENVIPPNSGSAASPITFKPYPGEQVTLSGADTVTGWTQYSGSIYRAQMSWNMGAGNNQLFVNGKNVMEARWPNSTDLSYPNLRTMASGSAWSSGTEGTIRDSSLTQAAGTWTDALVYMQPGRRWYARTGRITGSGSGYIKFKIHSAGHLSYEDIGKHGGKYFITGTLKALDRAGEWFFDGSTMYLWAPDSSNPNNLVVEAKRRQNVFDLSNRSYINVEGFKVIAAAMKTNGSTRNCIIDGVDASYVNHFFVIDRGPYAQGNVDYTGFVLTGSNNEIRNSKIAYSAGNGVTLQGTNNKVTNCEIRDVVYGGTDAGAINTAAGTTSGHIIKNNTLFNSGRSILVHINAQNIKILNNYMYNAGLQMTDLGITYTIATDGKGTEIAYNVVYGCTQSGIYLDNNNRNYNVHHNVVYDVRYALHLNRPSVNNNVIHNTVGPLRSSGQALAGFPDTSTSQYRSDMSGTVIRNNIFRASSWDVGTDPRPTMSHNIESSVDPRFVNASQANFQLQSNSPAINAGMVTPFSGQYTGKSPDCGAFEYGLPPWTAGSAQAPKPPTPPTLSLIGDKQAYTDLPVAFTVSASEPNGDPVTFSVIGLPPGAIFDPNTQAFAWTPGESQIGAYGVTFTATDKDGADSQSITITVTKLVLPTDQIAEWKFEGNCADRKGRHNGTPKGSVSYVAGKSGQAIQVKSGAGVDIAPDPALDSLTEMTMTAWVKPVKDGTDKPIMGFYKNNFDRAYIRVTMDDKLRVFNDITDIGTGHDSGNIASLMNTWFFVAWTYDANGVSQIYVNGQKSGVPMQYGVPLSNLTSGYSMQIGYEPFLITGFNGQIDEMMLFGRALSPEEISLMYQYPSYTKAPPSLAPIGDKSAHTDKLLTFTVSAFEPDGDTVSYSATGLPAGAAFDQTTQTFSWTPSQLQAGTYEVTFTATGKNGSDSQTITIAVVKLVLPTDHIAYWEFEANSRDTRGTLNGTPKGSVGYDAGEHGQALALSNSAYVEIPSNPALDSMTEMTMTAWIKPTKDGTDKPILSLYKNAFERIYIRLNTDDKLRVFNDINDIGRGHDSANIASLMNTWFFVAWTYDGNNVSQIYVNGQKSGASMQYSVPLKNLDPGFSMQIGYEPFLTFSYNGQIDEMMLFRRALSADEIKLIYENPRANRITLNYIPDMQVDEGTTLSFTLGVKSAQGGSVLFGVEDLPEGATLDSQTGAFAWTPTYSQNGRHEVVFNASDSLSTDFLRCIIVVNNVPVGDVNNDCVVDVYDLVIVLDCLSKDVNSNTYWMADVNNDGRIDLLDLIEARNRLGARCP